MRPTFICLSRSTLLSSRRRGLANSPLPEGRLTRDSGDEPCFQLQLVGAGFACTAFNCENLGFWYALQGVEEVSSF
jgi:hypothetical protein